MPMPSSSAIVLQYEMIKTPDCIVWLKAVL